MNQMILKIKKRISQSDNKIIACFRNILMRIYYRGGVFVGFVKWKLLGEKIKSPFDIPIIINNFNRYSMLLRLIDSLELRGYKNLYIIDNKSTYPPLIDYYESRCPYKIFRLKNNVGFRALWDTEIFEYFKNNYYVYTDADMEIDKDCPIDFMQLFLTLLNKYTFVQKVGFGIRIDNLPNHFKNRTKVVEWESKFWEKIKDKYSYIAQIDSTFALYKPYAKGGANKYQIHLRTSSPYLIQHLPWYVDSQNLSVEEQYYLSQIKQSTHWSCLQ